MDEVERIETCVDVKTEEGPQIEGYEQFIGGLAEQLEREDPEWVAECGRALDAWHEKMQAKPQ